MRNSAIALRVLASLPPAQHGKISDQNALDSRMRTLRLSREVCASSKSAPELTKREAVTCSNIEQAERSLLW
jgi:hypothetical protein